MDNKFWKDNGIVLTKVEKNTKDFQFDHVHHFDEEIWQPNRTDFANLEYALVEQLGVMFHELVQEVAFAVQEKYEYLQNYGFAYKMKKGGCESIVVLLDKGLDLYNVYFHKNGTDSIETYEEVDCIGLIPLISQQISIPLTMPRFKVMSVSSYNPETGEMEVMKDIWSEE